MTEPNSSEIYPQNNKFSTRPDPIRPGRYQTQQIGQSDTQQTMLRDRRYVTTEMVRAEVIGTEIFNVKTVSAEMVMPKWLVSK